MECTSFFFPWKFLVSWKLNSKLVLEAWTYWTYSILWPFCFLLHSDFWAQHESLVSLLLPTTTTLHWLLSHTIHVLCLYLQLTKRLVHIPHNINSEQLFKKQPWHWLISTQWILTIPSDHLDFALRLFLRSHECKDPIWCLTKEFLMENEKKTVVN